MLIFFVMISIIPDVYAQEYTQITISEVDINPTGDDSKRIVEWVEIHNPTSVPIDIGGWDIASTTGLKKTMTIPLDTIINPGEYITYTHQILWFTNINESIELKDSDGVIIDKTPSLTDTADGSYSWQKVRGGNDNEYPDTASWILAPPSPGSPNRDVYTDHVDSKSKVTVMISTDKDIYTFGESVIIKGVVSEQIVTLSPIYQAEQVSITITGSNYTSTIKKYPDAQLRFSAEVVLQKTLGINQGEYTIKVAYVDSTDTARFQVDVVNDTLQTLNDRTLVITTDKILYTPGEYVEVSAFSSDVGNLEGVQDLVYSVTTDPDQTMFASGVIYPVNDVFSNIQVYISPVTPTYGIYNITAEYAGVLASTWFTVSEELVWREDTTTTTTARTPISLETDKTTYNTGESVMVNGRLNGVVTDKNVVIKVLQTGQSATHDPIGGSATVFKIDDGTTVSGDGTFEYLFEIPDNPMRYGYYTITVTDGSNYEVITIHVTDDNGTINDISTLAPITIHTDKPSYSIGETITFSGFIKELYSGSAGYASGTQVIITIYDQDGNPLSSVIDTPPPSGYIGNDPDKRSDVINYQIMAIPEISGKYSVMLNTIPTVFSNGTYTVTAKYLSKQADTTFEITDQLNNVDDITISLDKDIYGLGETITLSGILPNHGVGAVDIQLTKPDGNTINSGARIDSQMFSWSWVTPMVDVDHRVQSDERYRNVPITTVYGVYKINVSADSFSQNVIFKVSENPDEDSLVLLPISVAPQKSLYKAGEKLNVIGAIIHDTQDTNLGGASVPSRVTITVKDGSFPFNQIHESFVYPDAGGEFSSSFELPATIFDEGSYKVSATYGIYRAENWFSVVNDVLYRTDEPIALIISTDKKMYHPGDIMYITGKPNKNIYLEGYQVSVAQKADDEITCGSFECGVHSGSVTYIWPDITGAFSHQFVIPEGEESLGTYEIVADGGFATASILVNVTTKIHIPITIIEKDGRIQDESIIVQTTSKTTDGDNIPISPRVLSGSMITTAKGQEGVVNLAVYSASGTCIIGQDIGCLVSESTRGSGYIHEIVQADGIKLKVGYSGTDVKFERFSILPESSDDFLPDTTWEIKVTKDDNQTTRLYYKITYKTTG